MSENKEKIIENGASNKDNKTKFLAIGAGFGRTGTMTFTRALEILGFDPCYHMIKLIEDPLQINFRHIVHFGEKYSWSEIFTTKYNSSSGGPCCLHWDDILKEYPSVK